MHQPHTASLPAYAPEELLRTINSSVCAMDYNLAELKHFHWTRFGGTSLGEIDVFRNEGFGIRHGQRTARHIQQDHVNDVLVSIPRSAQIMLKQNDTTIHLEPGTFAFCTTAVPCNFEIAPVDHDDNFSMIHVRVSGNALRRRVPHIDACCHRPIQLRPGTSRIMQSLFELTLSEGGALSASQAHYFSSLLIDAIANTALDAPELSALAKVAMTPQQRIRDAAVGFIQRHLGDPLLDVGKVADYCNISVRHLHATFSASGTSIGALIRESRLQQCRNALRSPALLDKSVTEIAFMWGFNDPSGFCRAYKSTFGITPSQERRLANLH